MTHKVPLSHPPGNLQDCAHRGHPTSDRGGRGRAGARKTGRGVGRAAAGTAGRPAGRRGGPSRAGEHSLEFHERKQKIDKKYFLTIPRVPLARIERMLLRERESGPFTALPTSACCCGCIVFSDIYIHLSRSSKLRKNLHTRSKEAFRTHQSARPA